MDGVKLTCRQTCTSDMIRIFQIFNLEKVRDELELFNINDNQFTNSFRSIGAERGCY